MVNKIGVQIHSKTAFKANGSEKTEKPSHSDALLVNEKHPTLTNLKLKSDKLIKSFSTYPKKGLEGSKNANFYEFLSMGTVPYLIGSAAMIGVFNFANKYFADTQSTHFSSALGKKMGIGVALYAIFKTVSKKFIETPVKLKHGIDVNMPYQKVVYELPEKNNKNNLIKKETHKVYESVDFPRWDLLYGNKKFGDNRNAYYDKIAKKMGFDEKNLSFSDQKVQPLIRKKVVQTKLFSTLSSYLWAATGVGIAMQEPWKYLKLEKGNILKNTASAFVKSCKEFVTNDVKAYRIAGKTLLGLAAGVTLLGNLVTLVNVNKNKGDKPSASTSMFDPKKEKVVC